MELSKGTKRSLLAEVSSFRLSVAAGILAALAGGLGYQIAAIIFGSLAAAAPIVGRAATNHLAKSAKAEADARVAAAEEEVRELRSRLGPRLMTSSQLATIAQVLRTIEPFAVGVNHNRREVEPSEYSEQIRAALTAGGISAGWFGGATNATRGVEISGPDGPNKRALLAAFEAAKVPALSIFFSDDQEGKRGIEIWVGVHPGLM